MSFFFHLATPPHPHHQTACSHLVKDTDQRSILGFGSELSRWLGVLLPPTPAFHHHRHLRLLSKVSPNCAKLLPSRLLLCSDKPDTVYFSWLSFKTPREPRTAELSVTAYLLTPVEPTREMGSFLPIQALHPST